MKEKEEQWKVVKKKTTFSVHELHHKSEFNSSCVSLCNFGQIHVESKAIKSLIKQVVEKISKDRYTCDISFSFINGIENETKLIVDTFLHSKNAIESETETVLD